MRAPQGFCLFLSASFGEQHHQRPKYSGVQQGPGDWNVACTTVRELSVEHSAAMI